VFTGIIQSIGVISAIKHEKNSALLEIEGDLEQGDIQIGESIAVNGCCLTVVDKKTRRFSADLSDETLRLTTFASAQVGERVNLERALRFSDRLGGHLVTGHVDAVGEIAAIEANPGSIKMSIACDRAFSKYIVSKGSVAIDGISLTLSLDAEPLADKTVFSVYIIPHTGTHTTLIGKRVGDRVNLEWDYLAKITESLLSHGGRI
jgi:riboflavin synthase